MKMHNFTIKGNFLEIVGRVVNNGARKPVIVYDLEFPCGMSNMSLEELKNAIKLIEEDTNDLFYHYSDVAKNETIREFEEMWSRGGEEDAN